jgi:hypothetical protein
MNITIEQAKYLLELPKKVFKGDKLLLEMTIEQKFPFHERFELLSEKDDEFSFLWEIKQSTKNTLKISLHILENDSKIGLLRIDYNGVHTNPHAINENVPKKFHTYVGKRFTQSHIHYYVPGYPPLAWAIPLIDDNFEIKTIEHKDLNTNLKDIIILFAKTVNIETVITINGLLL